MIGNAVVTPLQMDIRMKPLSCRDKLEYALDRIADPKGEGVRTCLTVYTNAARAAADAADARAASGISLGPLDGTIVTIKDLFDVSGEVTRAGSKVLAEEGKPAAKDAVVVRRLRAAGAVIVGKTNMSEFAFTAIGVNPHFGTPGNPADRSRVPGGSSSGAAVAVADGMCEIAIGSDTGGSVRMPAALCGVVGFKPSRQRVSTEGAFPLSYSYDSIGPLARSVADCAKADAILAGEDFSPLLPATLDDLHVGVVEGPPLANLDECVAKGGIIGAEACAVHRDRIARRGSDIDANVRYRIERGRDISAADFVDMVHERGRLIRAMDEVLESFDVLAMPTIPIVAPTIAEVAEQKAFSAANAVVRRNTVIGNFFDLCAVSLPLSARLPVGLMLLARNGGDRKLLRIAAAIMDFLQRESN
jgi:aspartyl-tRNA(Asn)/glutamyl-tRNA(Gln) amidotransferase subunit A